MMTFLFLAFNLKMKIIASENRIRCFDGNFKMVLILFLVSCQVNDTVGGVLFFSVVTKSER